VLLATIQSKIGYLYVECIVVDKDRQGDWLTLSTHAVRSECR